MLKRLKLADSDGRISLTNLAVYVGLGAFAYSVVRSGVVDLSGLAALVTALIAYRTKMWQEDRAAARETAKLRADLADTRKELDRAQRAAAPSRSSGTLPAGLR